MLQPGTVVGLTVAKERASVFDVRDIVRVAQAAVAAELFGRVRAARLDRPGLLPPVITALGRSFRIDQCRGTTQPCACRCVLSALMTDDAVAADDACMHVGLCDLAGGALGGLAHRCWDAQQTCTDGANRD